MSRWAIAVSLCVVAVAQETVPTFQSKVNLVLVPVVVRDAQGRAVGNLTKDDFELFDKGKPQNISTFSAIRRAQAASPSQAKMESRLESAPQAGPSVQAAGRHFIYVFDDVNTRFTDLANLRAAAERHFQNSFASGDQAAIYTPSGNPTLEFTDNREALVAAASKLRWRALVGRGGMQCPDVSYYIADLIVNQGDGQALAGLTNHTAECSHTRPELARLLAVAAANRALILGYEDSLLTLSTLRRAIQRLSGMTGERVIVLASPGFFTQTPAARKATAAVLELAAKAGVVINGLSVRGVILAEEEEDVARQVGVGRRAVPRASSPDQLWLQYRRESARNDGDVLKDLAEGTGGILFQNNNDLNVGLGRAAAAPEYSYVLGFSSSEMNPDGSFHALKVRLTKHKGAVEARRGYYALPGGGAEAAARAAIDDALFLDSQRTDFPVVLQTGYSKPKDSETVKVQLVARIDLSSFQYQKADGRNRDSITAVAALFDQDGGYLTGSSDTVNLNLLDEEVRQKDPAVTMRWEFPEVKPGDYSVRLVLREREGEAMTSMKRSLKVF